MRGVECVMMHPPEDRKHTAKLGNWEMESTSSKIVPIWRLDAMPVSNESRCAAPSTERALHLLPPRTTRQAEGSGCCDDLHCPCK